jgi:hypothetical protein
MNAWESLKEMICDFVGLHLRLNLRLHLNCKDNIQKRIS